MVCFFDSFPRLEFLNLIVCFFLRCSLCLSWSPNRWNEDTFGPHFKATPLEGIVAPLTETGIEVVFTPEGVDDDIRREGVLCSIEVRMHFRIMPESSSTQSC